MLSNCGVVEDSWESLGQKEIKPVNPKGNQPWTFIVRTDAKAETPVRWPPDVKNWFTGKDPDAGKDWRQEKGTTEDEMVSWHHQLNGHEFAQAPGVGDGQGSLAGYSPCGCKESDVTEWLRTHTQSLYTTCPNTQSYHLFHAIQHFQVDSRTSLTTCNIKI